MEFRVLGESMEPLPGPKTIVVLGYAMECGIPRLRTVDFERSYTDTLTRLHGTRVSLFRRFDRSRLHPARGRTSTARRYTGGSVEIAHFPIVIFSRLASALAGYYALRSPDVQKNGEHQIDVRLLHRCTVSANRRFRSSESSLAFGHRR